MGVGLLKVYLLVEVTDYDCTDEEKIINIYSSATKAEYDKNFLEIEEIERVKKNPHHRDPFNYFYEVREYTLIDD